MVELMFSRWRILMDSYADCLLKKISPVIPFGIKHWRTYINKSGVSLLFHEFSYLPVCFNNRIFNIQAFWTWLNGNIVNCCIRQI